MGSAELAVPGSLRADLGRLVRHSAIYTAAAVLSRGAGFLLLPLYTRYLSAADYGTVAVAGLVTSVLGILLPLSLHAALARLYHEGADESWRRSAVGTVWAAVAILGLGGALLLDWLGPAGVGAAVRSVPYDPYLRLAVWTAFFNAVGLVPLQLLQTAQRARAYALLSLTGVAVTTALIILFTVVRGEGAEGYLRATLIGSAVLAAASAVVVRPLASIALRPAVLRAALLFGVPLVPHQLAGWVLELSDRAILERYVPLAALGIYAVGYQVGLVMSVLASSANSAFAPYLYAADAEHGAVETERRIARLATYFVLGLGAAAAALFALAGDLVRLLAPASFAAAEDVARPVVLGQFACGLYFIPSNLLFLRHRTRVIPVVTGTAAAVNIVLNLLLVPRFGYVAAAWTTFGAYVLMFALAAAAAARAITVHYEWRRIAVIAGALAATVALGWMLADVRGAGGVLLRVAAVGAFPAVLWLAGFAGPGERAAMVRARGALAVWALSGRRAP